VQNSAAIERHWKAHDHFPALWRKYRPSYQIITMMFGQARALQTFRIAHMSIANRLASS
jgi:hypothetical protein